MGRVLVGGLATGLVINVGETILNVPLAGAETEQALAARNLPPIGGGAIAYFVVLCFLLGILIVWIYAAVRPRLGPGPKTAVMVDTRRARAELRVSKLSSARASRGN
jgi:hypothetical protein